MELLRVTVWVPFCNLWFKISFYSNGWPMTMRLFYLLISGCPRFRPHYTSEVNEFLLYSLCLNFLLKNPMLAQVLIWVQFKKKYGSYLLAWKQNVSLSHIIYEYVVINNTFINLFGFEIMRIYSFTVAKLHWIIYLILIVSKFIAQITWNYEWVVRSLSIGSDGFANSCSRFIISKVVCLRLY